MHDGRYGHNDHNGKEQESDLVGRSVAASFRRKQESRKLGRSTPASGDELIGVSSADSRGLDRAFRTTVLPLGRPAIDTRLLRATVEPWWLLQARADIPGAAFGSVALTGQALRALFKRSVLRAIGLAIAGRGANFKFVQLVPLFVGTIPLGDGKKFANPATRIDS